MIKVIVADDHHLVRKGLCALLADVDDIEVIAEAENGQQALALTSKLQPDVLLVDVNMPLLSGTETAARVRTLGLRTQVIMLSMYSDDAVVRQALKNGARGYLLKSSVTEELLLAIRAANRGEMFLSPAVSGAVVADFLNPQPVDAPFEQLTSREREVLKLVAEGYTNNRVAKTLFLSTKTVEKHRANLMGKLGVNDLAGLIRVAIKHKLIFIDE